MFRSSAVVLCVSAAAFAGPAPPTPNVALDRTELQLDGVAGDTLTGSFEIDNRADCGVTLEKERATLAGITVECPNWELAAREDMRCDVTATRSSPGKLVDGFLVAARVAADCKVGPLSAIDARRRGELQALVDELYQLQKATIGDDNEPWKLKEQELAKKYDPAQLDRELAEREAEIETEREILGKVWAEAQQEHVARLERQRLKVELIQTDTTGMKVFEQKLADMRLRAQKEIDGLVAQREEARERIRALRDEKRKVISELENGAWHDKCGLTESEIWKQKRETLSEHLRNAGGQMVPVPREHIEKRAAEFDSAIAEASKRVDDLDAKVSATKSRWISDVRAFEAKRPEVERARQQATEKARTDLAQLEENGRKAVITYRGKFQAFDERRDQLREEYVRKREEWRKAYADALGKLRADRENARLDRDKKVRTLQDKISKLRNELATFESLVRNAHQKPQRLKVRIDATFRR